MTPQAHVMDYIVMEYTKNASSLLAKIIHDNREAFAQEKFNCINADDYLKAMMYRDVLHSVALKGLVHEEQ